MCGIGGVWARAGAPAGGEDQIRRALEAMNAAMFHRGPDDGGEVTVRVGEGILGLAARRLAIQDLSPAGHQPMRAPESGNWVVLNGEIYNFRELRDELEHAGFRFASGSDTEVLLRAYGHWGLRATLERLRGMYALALWDAAAERLVLARDRLGVKPLYIAEAGGRFSFASELRALLAAKVVTPSLSLRGLASYLTLGAVQEPLTLVEGVQSVPPGAWVAVDREGVSVSEYWSLREQFGSGCGSAGSRSDGRRATEEIRHVLEEAVALRLVSDAPIGVFLSGGLDSSSVVALAARASGRRLRTVSVVFDERRYSEDEYIREVADRFNTEHVEVRLSGRDLLGRLPQALEAMDQPTFDGVNTYVVSGAAHESGLKVALSGIGGDELFGGYPSFRRAGQLRAAAAALRRAPRRIGTLLARAVPLVRDDDQARKLSRWLGNVDVEEGAHCLLRELFGPRERAQISPATMGLPGCLGPAADALDDFNAVSLFELSHYLRNVLLRDTDMMGMAHSLEIREPLLDHRLVECVARLPGTVKRAGSGSKPLLTRVMGDDLPQRVTGRRKMGFTLPLASWLRGPLRATVEQTLLDPAAGGQIGRALDGQSVAGIWGRFLAGKASWVRPWALYTLKAWGDRYLPG